MKNLMTKTLKTLAVAGMTMGLALGVQAAEPVEYLEPVYKTVGGITSPTNGIEKWETLSTNVYTVVGSSASRVTWGTAGATSWYVVTNGTFQIDGGVVCAGNVNLILCDGAKLTVTNVAIYCAGIQTAASGSLAVYGQTAGTGKLSATGGGWGAGIGGGEGGAGSGITINGGTVTANGGGSGAGIGGGQQGSGSNITINGGTVTATGGNAAAGLGGGLAGAGSNITVRAAATVYACAGSGADVIGNGVNCEDAAEGNTIEAGARVFFNLTGIYDDDIGTWVEPFAPMPETFAGLVVMTRGTQTVDRVLVGGCDGLIEAALPAFTLTNAVSGATGTIEINAEKHTDFANTYLRLTNADGNLTLKVDKPEFAITQQPQIGNRYTIAAATTDGSEGITNYAWYASSDQSLGFVAITNANMEILYNMATVDGETIKSVDLYGVGYYVMVQFTLDGVNALPKGGSFHFACAETLVSDGGTLAQNGSDCVYTPELLDDGSPAYYFSFHRSSAFTISNLTYEVTIYDLVAQGKTLTTFPLEKGVEGSNYVCRVTYGDRGQFYTADSDVFEFRALSQVTAEAVTGATVLAAYTNEVSDATKLPGSSPWTVFSNTTVSVVYTVDAGYAFAGGESVFTNTVTASAASTSATISGGQLPTAKSHAITYAYKTNDVDVVETELTGLVNEAQTTFREIDSVEIETSKISLPRYRLVKAEPASWAAHEKTSDITVTISFDLAPIPPVTVVLPEVTGATAQLLAFNVNDGWASVATNEVPSNATVRVVWTVTEDGKALTGAGAVSAFQWQTELVASNSVQIAPQPIVGEAGESEITLNIDTRAVKKYFEKDDILPIWAAQGAEVEVEKVGGEKTSLVKNMSSTNTFAWVPAEQGTYNFSQNGFDDAQIIYTTPVEVTTNDLEVSGTTVVVTADGSPIEPQTEGTYAGKLMVASNSTVTATWTIAPGSGVYFMDGTKTYTQTFEAGKPVNPVSEAVTKPEEPNAPKLKLGVVAQRYPWDGKIDVQYWAQNTPNEGYQITVTVTLQDGTTASETKPCLNGKNVTDFDARAKFGEVQFPKGVKVKATLEKK